MQGGLVGDGSRPVYGLVARVAGGEVPARGRGCGGRTEKGGCVVTLGFAAMDPPITPATCFPCGAYFEPSGYPERKQHHLATVTN